MKQAKDNLVLIDQFNEFYGDGESGVDRELVNSINSVDWWVCERVNEDTGNCGSLLWADYHELHMAGVDFLETTPEDFKIAGSSPMIKVDDRLKRWSIEDGFYHA
jgi:hypothetical protein